MNFLQRIALFSFLLSLILFTSGCLKGDFDTPPIGGEDPNLPAESIMTVRQFLDTYYNPAAYNDMTDDKYIRGVVVSSDQSGNIFKVLYVQDEDGGVGVSLAIDEVSMFNVYPVGKRVFIKINGLTIGANNGTPQIGKGTSQNGSFTNIDRIPASLMREHIIPGMAGIQVEPKLKKITELGPSDLNTLVVLENLEFVNTGPNEIFAPPSTNVNVDLRDCDDNVIILRNSGFSQFASNVVPSGNGTITAIYNVFGNTKQLFIRDIDDIQFTGERCDGGGGGGIDGDRIRVKDLRALYSGSDVVFSEGFIQGIVISDAQNKNINALNMVVQDGGAGIVCRFKSDISVPLGTEVKVGLQGGTLSQFRDLLQVQNLENNRVEVLSANNTVTPLKLKISEINNSIHESTLITIEDVELSGGPTYAGSKTATDSSGDIALFTNNGALFSGSALPTGKVSLTAIVSIFDGTQQISIRNLSDVVGGGGGGGGGEPGDRIRIKDLRDQYTGTPATITSGYIQGIVISDYENGNINNQNFVIQDEDAGIVLRFTQPVSVPIGTEVKVLLNGGQLSEFRTLLQVQNLSNSQIEVLASNQTVTPRAVTVSQINKNMESTLVRISDATITGPNATFSGTTKINDNTGNIDCFTNSSASFSGSNIPSGTVQVTCIVSSFNGVIQVNIRRLTDIE